MGKGAGGSKTVDPHEPEWNLFIKNKQTNKKTGSSETTLALLADLCIVLLFFIFPVC